MSLEFSSLSLRGPRNMSFTVVWNFRQVSGRLLLSQLIVGVGNPVSSVICIFVCYCCVPRRLRVYAVEEVHFTLTPRYVKRRVPTSDEILTNNWNDICKGMRDS